MINQTVLKRQLLKAGLTCDGEHAEHRARASAYGDLVANHGEEALELMRRSQAAGGPAEKWYDCVLMDLEMPGTLEERSGQRAFTRAGC